MQITHLARRLLQLLFTLGSRSAARTRPRLERHLGVARTDLNRALAELEQLGLVDAPRLRLTLSGLACAVAFGAKGPGERRPRRAAAGTERAHAAAPIALFSAREAPRAVA